MENIELLAKAVKDSYKDGVPLHLHPTAQDESAFHILKDADFEALSDRQVQAILRRRHIVIHGRRRENDMNWNKAVLTLGGGLARTTEIQGIFFSIHLRLFELIGGQTNHWVPMRIATTSAVWVRSKTLETTAIGPLEMF